MSRIRARVGSSRAGERRWLTAAEAALAAKEAALARVAELEAELRRR